jgi:hypothetical protein
MVVLRPLVEQTLGSNLTDPAVVQRWMLTEFDLLTHGLIVERRRRDPRSTVCAVPRFQGDGEQYP